MQINNATQPAASRFGAGLRSGVLAALLTLMAGAAAGQTVAQSPLSIAGDVPGNLLLVPSVEWPTLDSLANINAYTTTRAYTGYFDSGKCYEYSYSNTERDRHFYPVSTTTNRICSGVQWSGNYLNWAATQTIDPFRKALTGGYRVRDTASETWLEKARHDNNGSTANRRIPDGNGTNSTLVAGATPANWSSMTVRIRHLGNRMRFTRTGTLGTTPAGGNDAGDTPTAYNPAVHTSLSSGTVYEVSVRVKVCDPSFRETNCVQYSQGWKPEGLIQEYSKRIRYSVFGYLNDGNVLRDGGVLRARQKFVGENKLDPTVGRLVANANQEWNPTTGQLIRNPDPADATATTGVVGQSIQDSGVINYINKFGQMTTQNHKSFDPVSELYYTAIRYLRNVGNVPAYTNLTGTAEQRFNLADGFPVITNWDDPMQYRCQNNAILGIGDVNTHRDKNLPGNTTVRTDEPTMPTEVSGDTGDTSVNVVTATAKVAQLEGITINTPYTGRENSAYLAGLAYHAHTVDLRTDLGGMQTIATHWVDVRENLFLEPRANNQYYLAAKYGGFAVPQGFAPFASTTTTLDAAWWSSPDTLVPNSGASYVRPQNFYVASEADAMVESLKRAFASIAVPTAGSATSLASSSTRLDDSTKTYQAQFVSGTWRGELNAFDVDDDGSLVRPALWQAGPRLTAAPWAQRRIYARGRDGYGVFTWANLSSAQQTALGSEAVVNYLRGDRSNETGTLRTRTGVLGDIVNSTPLFVGAPNVRLHVGATFTGASAYSTFASARRERDPVIYVGANDGMLHGFNANTGDETYAFVPSTVILNDLATYSDPGYGHRYFVDGEIAVSDIYDTSSNSWKTVLVGTLGRGGPGVFALDVTDPANVRFLWEKSGTDIAALGQNLGKPVIAQVANGDWRVVLGNGPGSSAAAAQLVTIRLRDGAVSVANTGAAGANGLTAAAVRDSDGDRFADDAYAGDLQGNLWKFTGLAGTPSITKLFEAEDPSGNQQPITAAPQVSKDPATGMVWVFFGTGQYLSGNDLNDQQVQTWYGLKDTGSMIDSRDDLVERDILTEGQLGRFTVRVIEEGTADDFLTQDGWFMDLVSPANGTEGERMVVPNRFQGNALIGTTRIPDARDPCRPGGRGFIMAINPFTGARLNDTFFDVNGDHLFNESDLLGGSVVSAIGTPDDGDDDDGDNGGSPNGPIFVGNVLQYSTDGGTTEEVDTQGSAVDASRMSWRELLN